MYGCSGCLGGYVRPPPAHLPEKGQRTLRKSSNRRVRGQSARSSQDWWLSSSHEVNDNCVVLNSQAAQKTLKASSFCNDASSDTNYNKFNNSPFVNHALNKWNKERQEWIGSQRSQNHELRDPVISWSTTYEDLLGTSRPFAQPVPLPEMVDFLVDVWEQEGLYG